MNRGHAAAAELPHHQLHQLVRDHQRNARAGKRWSEFKCGPLRYDFGTGRFGDELCRALQLGGNRGAIGASTRMP